MQKAEKGISHVMYAIFIKGDGGGRHGQAKKSQPLSEPYCPQLVKSQGFKGLQPVFHLRVCWITSHSIIQTRPVLSFLCATMQTWVWQVRIGGCNND